MINKLWNHLTEQVQHFLDDQPDAILSKVFSALDNKLYWSTQPAFANYPWEYEHAKMTMTGWLHAIELLGGDANKANDELRLLFLQAASDHLATSEREREFAGLQLVYEHNHAIELEAKSA